MFNQNYGVEISATCARTAYEKQEKMKRQKEQELNEYIEANIKSTQPIVDRLNALEEDFQSHVDETKKNREEDKKETKKDRNSSWVQFIVATTIAIAALVVSIIALYI